MNFLLSFKVLKFCSEEHSHKSQSNKTLQTLFPSNFIQVIKTSNYQSSTVFPYTERNKKNVLLICATSLMFYVSTVTKLVICLSKNLIASPVTTCTYIMFPIVLHNSMFLVVGQTPNILGVFSRHSGQDFLPRSSKTSTCCNLATKSE